MYRKNEFSPTGRNYFAAVAVSYLFSQIGLQQLPHVMFSFLVNFLNLVELTQL